MEIDDSKVVFLVSVKEIETIVKNILKEEREKYEKKWNDELITTNEVVNYLHCDHTTLWRWRKEGRLKGVRVGREILYKRSEILDLLK